jgi:hypothetical protein
MAVRAVAALLASGQDEAAIGYIESLVRPQSEDAAWADKTRLTEAVLAELDARTEAVADAASYAKAASLIERLRTANLIGLLGVEARVAFADEAARVRRSRLIDTLLNAISDDLHAGAKLLSYGAEAVLPRVCDRLASLPTTTSPATSPMEAELLQLARRLAPEWPGYEIGCTDAERAAALEALRASLAGSTSPPAGRKPATSAPSS